MTAERMSPPTTIIGAGFIGTAVAGAVAAAGRFTTLVARRPVVPQVGVQVVRGDAADPDLIRSVVQPGSVIVFAAGSSVPSADEKDPQHGTSALAPLLNTLEVAGRVAGVSFVFLSSGGTVYGEPEPGLALVGENHPLRPRSAYGASKAAAEEYVSYYSSRYDMPAVSLRCSNVYGPGQRPGRGQGLVAELLDAARRGGDVEIWGDGSIERDYVFIADVADAIAALSAMPELPPALNVGSGHGASVNDVIDVVRDITRNDLRVKYKPGRPFDVHRIVLDVAILRSLIPFAPRPLVDGIGSTWSSLRRNTVA